MRSFVTAALVFGFLGSSAAWAGDHRAESWRYSRAAHARVVRDVPRGQIVSARRHERNAWRKAEKRGDKAEWKAEKRAWKADRRDARKANWSRRFRGLDRNRNGVITRSEWRGNRWSFNRFDRNRDGRLSWWEY